MKRYSWIVAFFFILLPLTSFAEEDAAVLTQTDCAVAEDGGVAFADGTLCEQDIAFGMLYEMFPAIFDELMPLWNLSSFSKLGETQNSYQLMAEYNGSNVFFVLFDFFYDLVIACIITYVLLMFISQGVRVLKGDDLNDASEGKDTPMSTAGGVIAGSMFLLPYKNFFVGQMVVFSLGIGALSMANFFYSMFLSGNQAIFVQTSNPARISNYTAKGDVQERHDFQADTFYRQLVRMDLCRMRSSEFTLTGMGPNAQSQEEYRNMHMCTAASPDVFTPALTWVSDGGTPPFLWYKTTRSSEGHGGVYLYGKLSNIAFESKATQSNACLFNGESSPDYKCGEMDVHNPDWGSNPLVRLLDDPSVLKGHIESLKDALHPGTPAGNIKGIIQSRWELLRSDLQDSLESAWQKASEGLVDGAAFDVADASVVSTDNEVVQKGDSLRAALQDNARPHFRQAAQFFHQEAMNLLMFGQAFSYYKDPSLYTLGAAAELGGDLAGSTYTPGGLLADAASDYALAGELTESGVTFSGIEYHMQRARELSEIVLRGQCNNFRGYLSESENTAAFLRGEKDGFDGKSAARCVDVDAATVMEYEDGAGERDIALLRAEAEAREEELKSELDEKWRTYVSKLAAQRRAVEQSFADTVSSDGVDTWWVNLRQKGYLSAADYAQSANSVMMGYKRALKQIVNNFSIEVPSYSEEFVSKTLYTRYDSTVQNVFHPLSYGGGRLLDGTSLPAGKMDPLIDSTQWLVQQESLIRENPLGVDDDTVLSQMSEMLSMPTTYLDRLGISTSLNAKTEERCLEDPKGCPFPLSDPLVELSMLGHDMVDVSTNFFMIGLPAKIASGPNARDFIMSNQRGSVSDGSMTGFLKGAAMESVVGLVGIASIVDTIYDILSTVMTGVLLIGVGLAYMLPLIPKIYLYLNFVSWLSVVVMASFSVLLWSFFWFRMKEKRDMLRQAGFHYGIELMFKPTFSLISVIFAWYFFYVIAFAVGHGIGWMWGMPLAGNDGMIRPYFDMLMIILVICMAYFVGLHYTYQLMDDMINELMKRLGVRNIKDNDRISDFVKAMIFNHAKNAIEHAHDMANKKFGRTAAKADLMGRLNSARGKIRDHNQGMNSVMGGNGGGER